MNLHKTTTLLFLLTLNTIQWHPTGHFMTARIAELEIQEKRPTLLPALNKILTVLTHFTKERSHPFVESACYPDDIKYISWKTFNKWHFYDQPIYAKNYKPATTEKPEEQNLVWAINECKNTLRNTKSSLVTDYLGKSFCLRYIIHLIGDIHQPLHTGALYSEKFKKGDTGGNAFKIVYPGSDGNLHSFWDKTLKVYKDIRAPISASNWKTLNKYCEDLRTNLPRSMFKDRLAKTSVRDWQKEGNAIAKKNVYNGVVPDGVVPEKYVEDNVHIVKEQLVLGGYRLADTLLELFENTETLVEHVKLEESGEEKVHKDEDKQVLKKDDESMEDEEVVNIPVRNPDSFVEVEDFKEKKGKKKNFRKQVEEESWHPSENGASGNRFKNKRNKTSGMVDESMDFDEEVDQKVSKYILKGSAGLKEFNSFLPVLGYCFVLMF